MSNNYESFYSEQYKGERYANTYDLEKHAFYKTIREWLDKHPDFQKKSFLEVGSGRGALQNIVDNYTGIDISDNVSQYYKKPFICCSAEEMPFDDDLFDVVWSYAVWEHLPNPERAFEEVVRVAKRGGYFILCPAWHCRPWAANGYQVRPYSDFNLAGKIYKFMIPFLDWMPVRLVKMFFYRLVIWLRYRFQKEKLISLYYKKLKANYEEFWQSDSDACNDLDLFPVILWFESRGCKCITYPTRIKQFLSRTGTVEFLINK